MTRVVDEDRIIGTLLGTALGDALGLATEGMSAQRIARRFGRVERFRLWRQTGFVSDDTELSALMAQSLVRFPDDLDLCIQAFRRSLVGWCSRLPWGVGRATLRAGLRAGLGIAPSGVNSAGNGAAMRAPIVGSVFPDQDEKRTRFGRALAEVTHRDPRAVEGAIYVADLAAACVRGQGTISRQVCQDEARRSVNEPDLGQAIDQAQALAEEEADTTTAALACKTSGFVNHTLSMATFSFLRFGHDPLTAFAEIISAGGDTDSSAAILGAWLGAFHGSNGLAADLIGRIHDGPFGPSHLRALGAALAKIQRGETTTIPHYSPARALGRNLVLYPVILGHGFRRLLPF